MLFDLSSHKRAPNLDMKKLTLLALLTIFKFAAFAGRIDTTYQQQKVSLIDSLQQKLDKETNDSLKSAIYADIARQYLGYDTITNKKNKLYYQNQALNYTMMALHSYSRFNDSTGLFVSFANLARVYRSQKKYSQAKWFILQANTLARAKYDQPAIISTLTELAGIKMDIKDYELANRDLDEALKISTSNHYPLAEALVQKGYALLYSHLKKYDREAKAMRRHDYIIDSIKKAEERKLIAKLNVQNLAQRKKKLNLISYRRNSRTNLVKRIASI